MRKTVIFLAAALALFSSCQRLNIIGKPVVFSASAKSTATKTVYAGIDNNSDTHEDIYWVDGDQILIQSSDAAVAATPSDAISSVYSLTADSDARFASLSNTEPNGLIWNETSPVTFYGVYPGSTTATGVGQYNMTIPTEQTFANPTATVMTNAYMVAKTSVAAGANNVNMEFYPAFTAFEIHMKSAEGTVNLTRFAIKSASTDLAGDYSTDWTGSDMAFAPVSGGTNQKEVYVEFPGGTTVTATQEVSFTLLALPYDLTNLYLEVTYDVSGTAITKKLQLKNNGSYISFAGCSKHRITGLAFDGGSNWRLTINDVLLPWDREDGSTTFSQNIEAGPFSISNATETGNHYYPTGTKDYQVRTLDLENGKNHFVVTFLPMAPLGGYWMLVPESNAGMGTAAFRVVVWDDPDEDDPNDPTAGNPDLKGQIMNQTVTLHIFSMVTDEQRTEDHAIIIKSYFSSSISFDENSTFSADSEIQDAHKDGSFSYWRFVIPAKNN